MQLLEASLSFVAAVDIWLGNHAPYIKRSTLRVYRQYARVLADFFGEVPIGKIHIGNVRGFQHWRLQAAGPLRCNAEVSSVLVPILKEINLWRSISDVYRPLPVPKRKIRQNMSETEERRLMAVALDSSKPRRLLAGHCLIIMANTGMGFGELRHLKREDVLLNEDRPIVTVNGGTKNDYRIRTIPLNFFAKRSMKWVLHRWEDLGGSEPDQYILPHHARRSADEQKSPGHNRKSPPIFTEPMGHIYRAAREILKEASLSHLDPYDMRSHFGTKLLADPDVSDQMFQEIFGHSNTRTRDRYSKQRIEKKAVAIDRLCLDVEPKVRLLSFPGGRK